MFEQLTIQASMIACESKAAGVPQVCRMHMCGEWLVTVCRLRHVLQHATRREPDRCILRRDETHGSGRARRRMTNQLIGTPLASKRVEPCDQLARIHAGRRGSKRIRLERRVVIIKKRCNIRLCRAAHLNVGVFQIHNLVVEVRTRYFYSH
ncbi:hypothetical protein ACFFYR_27970 [Paraburkholderia dipogonis]|uniref:hypothetical protein n=1 Tax=Paraburkholderia dipogonis TaxID=1211383 RepID=UPI00141BF28E|nr:hypothetical protein [Paraburkholderia dipogonis]